MNALSIMPHVFSRYYIVITSFRNMEKKRTQEDWTRIQENAINAILMGRCANNYYGEMSIDSLVDEALRGADLLVEELRKREKDQ